MSARRAWVARATFSAGFVLLGCSNADSSPPRTFVSESGALRLDVRLSPDPPMRGTVAAELSILRTADGTPVDGLTLSVVPWMPAMNHGAGAYPTVTPQGGGRYDVGNLDLYMAGRWELQIAITGMELDSRVLTDHADPSFDIP